jgi:hypothetical protein
LDDLRQAIIGFIEEEHMKLVESRGINAGNEVLHIFAGTSEFKTGESGED